MSDSNIQIDPNLPLTVTITLQAQHWVALQRYLDNGPHGIVRPVLDEIQRQGMAAAMRQRATRFSDGSIAATASTIPGQPEGFSIGARDNGE